MTFPYVWPGIGRIARIPDIGYVAITDIYYRGRGNLQDLPISGSHRRMGRPPLNIQPVLIRLPVAAVARIRALVGDGGLAQFVREAVENELKRRSRKKPGKPRKAEPKS